MSSQGPHSAVSVPAYYVESIRAFLGQSDAEVLGRLTASSQFPVTIDERNAWIEEFRWLRPALREIEGTLLLEFDIPRLGSRIDAVVLTGSALIVLEFKCGANDFTRADYDQAWDYALDLKNFHGGSHELEIFPILIATEAAESESYWSIRASDGVYQPLRCNGNGLRAALRTARARAEGASIDADMWARSPYRPSPSIIEAAQSLYARHSVEAISRSDAGAKNLHRTSGRVEQIVKEAQARGEKAIIFVTGVPGAGKTLVGLNIATHHRRESEPTHAVFLSGNAPLVAVLQEALTRDELERRRAGGERIRKGDIRQQVKPFIQNIHRFRDEGIRNAGLPPTDHVVIFDEAQRAWNEAKAKDFMKRRKGVAGFDQSEAQFLISYMDRHADWAVIVCLVGGGQEIHTGEAGISSWVDAVREHYKDWSLYISPKLTDSEYAAEESLAALVHHPNVVNDEDLHLSVSMRSFRAEHVSSFVKAVLDADVVKAREVLGSVQARYPIAVTRDLDIAKKWIRSRARGSERFGLVASSQAQRLKPHAVDVRINVDPVHWFLGPREDTRSSYYLEDAATEFQVQGLELDWMLVTWDADLRRQGNQWSFHDFHGAKWRNILQEIRQQYLLNAYRVLLTRARQGMVIFVPPGDPGDHTRPPEYYDETFAYLTSLGIPDA
jgi:hypothetical protein